MSGLTTRPKRSGRAGFTLIEVLVVVAIIALLVSILLPSLNKAREASRRSVCLSNLHQQGVAMVPYAQDHKGQLPQRGSFSYYIAENPANHIFSGYVADRDRNSKVPINNGKLYGRYSGKGLNLFYCPSLSKEYAMDPEYGIHTFLDKNVRLTFGGYGYAAPVRQSVKGKSPTPSPSTGVKGPYPQEIWDDMYTSWVEDRRLGLRYKDANPNWNPPRQQALLSDCLVGNGKLLHQGGVSALFSDLHAKFIKDRMMGEDKITKGQKPFIAGRGITSGPGGSPNYYDVWTYLAENQ